MTHVWLLELRWAHVTKVAVMQLGPCAGSRCILQSPGFSREGFEMISVRPSAGCYKTLCKGEDGNRQLYVEFEGSGVQVPCPSGALIDLNSIEGVVLPSHLLLSVPLLVWRLLTLHVFRGRIGPLHSSSRTLNATD